jgi:hypothetical protein
MYCEYTLSQRIGMSPAPSDSGSKVLSEISLSHIICHVLSEGFGNSKTFGCRFCAGEEGEGIWLGV